MSSHIRIKAQGKSTLYGGQNSAKMFLKYICFYIFKGFFSFHLGFWKTHQMDFDTRHLTQLLLTFKGEQF